MSARTHDLRRGYWGHDISFLSRRADGSWRVCIFLSARISDGDHVLALGRGAQPGETVDLRYRVVGDVDRPLDPGDQHFATLVFDPEPTS